MADEHCSLPPRRQAFSEYNPRMQARLLSAVVIFLPALACTSKGIETTGTSGAASPRTENPAPTPTGSCDELEQQYDVEARKLAKACKAKEDCSLSWSDFNCYALRSTSDDVSALEAIDAAMAAKGCSEVECEPPPVIKCEAGVCDWDL
jgi:hypothetical protein